MIQIRLKDGKVIVVSPELFIPLVPDVVKAAERRVLAVVAALPDARDPTPVIQEIEVAQREYVAAYEAAEARGSLGAITIEGIDRLVWGEVAWAVNTATAARTDGPGKETLRILTLHDEVSGLVLYVPFSESYANELGQEMQGKKVVIATEIPTPMKPPLH